jgi:hypothetical protein
MILHPLHCVARVSVSRVCRPICHVFGVRKETQALVGKAVPGATSNHRTKITCSVIVILAVDNIWLDKDLRDI